MLLPQRGIKAPLTASIESRISSALSRRREEGEKCSVFSEAVLLRASTGC